MAPKFWEEAREVFRAATAFGFVLHGDGVKDYPEHNGYDLVPWLQRKLIANEYDLVICYDPANGITFPSAGAEGMRKLFESEVLGVAEQKQQNSANPFLNAMQGNLSSSSSEVDLRLSLQDAMPILDKAMNLATRQNPKTNKPFKVAVIFSMADLTFPAMPTGPLPPALAQASAYILTWLRNPIWRVKDAPMIWFVTPSLLEVAEAVREAYAIRLNAPNFDERLAYVEFILKSNNVELDDDITPRRIAAMTAGLLRIHIEDVIVKARIENRKLTAALIRDRKDQIMATRFAGVLETSEATRKLEDVAGLDYLKTFLANEIVNPMKNGDTDGMPMGVLMAGPPGTGKTYIAECLAGSAGVNFVLFRMSNILGSYVGESEQNLEKALQGIQEMTPCIVFVDEVEQSVRRDTGGSGNSVMGNIFGRLLNAMSDSKNRGKVVWLMATNRPDLLDSAFKRSGRIDAKFAVMPPDSDDERAAMFLKMAAKNRVRFAADVTDESLRTEIAPRCVDYTGADIEVIVNKARKVAYANSHDDVTLDDVRHAVKAIRIPQNDQTRLMIALALDEVNDLDNLPPSYRQRWLNGEFDNGSNAAESPAAEEVPGRRAGRRADLD